MTGSHRRRLEVEEAGDRTVVSFMDKKMQDEVVIQVVGEQLFRLVDELGKRNVLLNLADVEYVSSAMLGKFITLHKKLQAVGGQLTLCGVDAQIYKMIESAKLNKLFEMQMKGEVETAPQPEPEADCAS